MANTLYATLGCQLHQFFMWCRVQEKLGVEWYRQVLNDVSALAFVRAETLPSSSQRRVSESASSYTKDRWIDAYTSSCCTLQVCRLLFLQDRIIKEVVTHPVDAWAPRFVHIFFYRTFFFLYC